MARGRGRSVATGVRPERGGGRLIAGRDSSAIIPAMNPLVGIVVGSQSDWEVMSRAAETLQELKLPCESRVLSAHRTPGLLAEYVEGAADRGLEVIIAGAGMAAHLPGVVASRTSLPVLGVPIDAGVLDGLDALLSMVQMPSGVPVATFAIGRAGAVNAALFAAMIVSQRHPEFAAALKERREAERQALSTQTIPQGS